MQRTPSFPHNAALLALGLVLATTATGRAQQPEGAPATTHEVARGETLWELAERYLGEAGAWQRIVEANPTILRDPPRIYPGQVIRIPAPGDTPADGPPGEGRDDPFAGPSLFDRPPDRGERAQGLSVERRAPEPLVTRPTFHGAARLLRPREREAAGRVTRVIRPSALDLAGAWSARQRDRVRVSLPTPGPAPGDTLLGLEAGHRLADGRVVASPRGLMVVDDLRDGEAVATVIALYGRLTEGALALPSDPYPAAVARRHRPDPDSLTTRVIGMVDRQALTGLGDQIVLGAGRTAGVAVGDEFLLWPTDLAGRAGPAPEAWIGTARVIYVGPDYATARVTGLRDVEVEAGGRALRIRRSADHAAVEGGP